MSLQLAVQNPTHPYILVLGCSPSSSWQADFQTFSDRIVTPPPHLAELIKIIIEAVQGQGSFQATRIVDWDCAPFLRALRNLLELDKQGTMWCALDSEGECWAPFCKWLCKLYREVSWQTVGNEAMCPRMAAWLSEAKMLLNDWWWNLSGLRTLVVSDALEMHLGNLQCLSRNQRKII